MIIITKAPTPVVLTGSCDYCNTEIQCEIGDCLRINNQEPVALCPTCERHITVRPLVTVLEPRRGVHFQQPSVPKPSYSAPSRKKPARSQSFGPRSEDC